MPFDEFHLRSSEQVHQVNASHNCVLIDPEILWRAANDRDTAVIFAALDNRLRMPEACADHLRDQRCTLPTSRHPSFYRLTLEQGQETDILEDERRSRIAALLAETWGLNRGSLAEAQRAMEMAVAVYDLKWVVVTHHPTLARRTWNTAWPVLGCHHAFAALAIARPQDLSGPDAWAWSEAVRAAGLNDFHGHAPTTKDRAAFDAYVANRGQFF